MSIARRLTLICGTALVAAACSTSVASADVPIEVVDETTGEHCNPCVIDIEGESHLNLFGGRVSTCEDHYVLAFNEDGTGQATYTNETHHDPAPPTACTRIACNGVGEPASEQVFDLVSTEEVAIGQIEMLLTYCVDPASNPNGMGTHSPHGYRPRDP